MPTAKKELTKTTPRTSKPKAVKPVEEEVIEEIIEDVKDKKEFKPSDGILCRSVTAGALYVEGPKSGLLYDFEDYDSEQEIEYRDLLALLRSKKEYLFTPYIIVEDDEFIEENSALKKFYDERFTVKDFKEILKLSPRSMIGEIEKLPKTALENFKVVVASSVRNGTLDSVKNIQALDNYFGTELNLISTLFGEE